MNSLRVLCALSLRLGECVPDLYRGDAENAEETQRRRYGFIFERCSGNRDGRLRYRQVVAYAQPGDNAYNN
jgi:hypothetical protein